MKKYFYIGVLAVLSFSICSCSNVYADYHAEESKYIESNNEYETIEMIISYKYIEFGHEEVYTILGDENDEQEYKFQTVVDGFFYQYLLNNSYNLRNSQMFLADGDRIKLTYNKGYEFNEKLDANDFLKLERIKTANIIKLDNNLIKRNDNGSINQINVNYKMNNVIVNDTDIHCISFENYKEDRDIYMSVSTDSSGEEYCIFYSFNPEEV